ncbi:hypothetical protein FRC18_006828 [Serendipita sp. 400]|nr:hypothetical protein FRC18_006828 [Serendipita sp. 400]
MDHPLSQASVVFRIPAEIWQQIFDLVLSTWLLPGDGYDLFSDLKLFQDGCVSYQEYRRVEIIRKSLRAVCRRWYQLLKATPVNIATTNLELYVSPQCIDPSDIRRLETYSDLLCQDCCALNCGSRMVEVKIRADDRDGCTVKRDRKVSSWTQFTDLSLMKRLQVFVHWNIGDLHANSDLTILTTIYMMPFLRALSAFTILTSSVLSIPQALTHLQLQCSLSTQHQQLRLPYLKFLHLLMTNDRSDQQKPNDESFGLWTIPQLVTLRLSGYITKERGEAIQKLILKVSHTITNLILDFLVRRSGQELHLSSLSVVLSVLQSCPQLTTLGLCGHSLVHERASHLTGFSARPSHPQPGARSLFILVIDDFHQVYYRKDRPRFMDDVAGIFDLDGEDEEYYASEEYIIDNLENSRALDLLLGCPGAQYSPWSLTRVIIPCTWSQYVLDAGEQHQPQLDNDYGNLPTIAQAFFKYFDGKNVAVFDEEGVRVHNELDRGTKLVGSSV